MVVVVAVAKTTQSVVHAKRKQKNIIAFGYSPCLSPRGVVVPGEEGRLIINALFFFFEAAHSAKDRRPVL